jgi:hypothetical protein
MLDGTFWNINFMLCSADYLIPFLEHHYWGRYNYLHFIDEDPGT